LFAITIFVVFNVQFPFTQIWPGGQVFPQVTQLLEFEFKSTQIPPQSVCPVGQDVAQAPFTQI
jgi:hypothetical protein